MSNSIPAVGSLALLDALTDFVPDDFINAGWPIPYRRGPRFGFSAAQLWRVHLLSALMGGRSFNAVQRSLREQRSLRRFARLPNEALHSRCSDAPRISAATGRWWFSQDQ